MASKQKKVAGCLSALGQAMTEIWKNPGVDKGVQVLEIISDASRMLLEVQREESLTRKSLVVSNLNPSMSDTHTHDTHTRACRPPTLENICLGKNWTTK